jgi:hypothetical protein
MLKYLMFSGLWCENNVPLQVVDFSPVITILQIFSRVFMPFFSRTMLVFRGLGKKAGLIESRASAMKLGMSPAVWAGVSTWAMSRFRKDGGRNPAGSDV